MGIIIRQSIKGTLVNYLGIVVGFVTTFFILTHYLTTEEVGLTRVLVDAAVLFSSFAQIGTASSIIRFFPYFKDEEGKNHGFFFWTLIVPIFGFLIFLLVLALFKQPIVHLFAEKSSLFVRYFRFVIPLSLFMLYQSVFEANCNVLMRIVVPKLVREVGVRVGLLIIYLLYGFHCISLDGLVIGFCITYLIAVLVDVIYLFSLQKISLKPDLKFISKPLVRDFACYSLLLTLTAIASNTPLLSSFFVSAKLGLGLTGIFAIANYIATVIEIPNRSLNAIVNPNLAQSIKENDWTKAQKLCKNVSLHLLLSSMFIFFIIWINVDVLFMILSNGDDYEAGKSVIFILGMARLANSTFSVSGSALNFSKYYYMSLVLTVLLTTMVIIFNIVFIPIWGINGSAFASFASYFIYYLLMLALVKWKLHISVFSKSQIKVIAIILGLFLINLVWTKSLTLLIMHLPLKALYVAIIDAVLRTIVLLALGVAATYYGKISKEVNDLIERGWRKVF
ncbi:MAG: oligosaccharide flippase family protein [Bacteroidales bacterium]|nr:oligosaccharide flippase family protein [Bacteroidales bacterium]